MKANLGEFWRQINEPEENPESYDVRGFPLCRLFYTYFWRPHWASVLLCIVLNCALGLVVFAYARSAQFIADDIVELSLVDVDTTEAMTLDPTLPGENRLFDLDEPHERSSWSARHDQSPGKSDQQKLELLAFLAIMLVSLEIVRHVFDFIQKERSVAVTQKAQFTLRRSLHDKLHALSLAYHDRHSAGRLMTYLFSDMMVVQNQITQMLRMIPQNIFAILGGIIIVLYINVQMGMFVIAALPAYSITHRWFRSRLRNLNRNLREREGRLNGHIANRVSNFQVVKAYGRESGEVVTFLKQARELLTRNVTVGMLNTFFIVICGLITGGCTTAVLWVGALQVRDGKMSAGEVLMFYAAAGYLFAPVANLSNLAGAFYRLRTVAAKIMHVMDEPITLTDAPHPVATPTTAPTIAFDNVTLTYDHANAPALQNISFTLPAGKRLCVMGPSGSGKTTIAKLAARLYDPTEGAVAVDGIDLRSFRIADLRDLVGFVGQEPIVFSGTIIENIRYGSQAASAREVVTAAQYAQAHDFITRMPDRYATLTQERGLTLSGGQKQRVNLARALMIDTQVLILDDCTSALDAETEARLIESFRTVLANRTCMLITHRTSIALECDYVLMLDAGRVVEFGVPEELLKSGGAFAAIVNEQDQKIEAAQTADTAESAVTV